MYGPDVTFLGVERCDHGVFASFDVDGVDPGMAPGTGTPEPGGFAARQALDAVRRIAIELPVVGIDVVEVSPPYDSSEITAFLELLAGIAFRRKEGTWDSIPKTLLEGRT
jgi:arginase family enzyme